MSRSTRLVTRVGAFGLAAAGAWALGCGAMLVLAAFGDETLPLRGESPALSALSGISTLVTAGFALWSAIRIHRRIADADHAADREPLAAIRNAAFSGQSRKD